MIAGGACQMIRKWLHNSYGLTAEKPCCQSVLAGIYAIICQMIVQSKLKTMANKRIPPGTPCKIGIIGPHNVGKTTLANLLNGHLKARGAHADLVPEAARNCPLPLKNQTSIESAYWLFGAQVAAESLVYATRQFAVCDRTVIDMYPFAVHTAQTLLPGSEQTEALAALEALSALIQAYLAGRPYQFLFYVPIGETAWIQDGKVDDHALQQAVDAEFRTFLQELAIPFHVLEGTDGQARVQEMVSLILKTRKMWVTPTLAAGSSTSLKNGGAARVPIANRRAYVKPSPSS